MLRELVGNPKMIKRYSLTQKAMYRPTITYGPINNILIRELKQKSEQSTKADLLANILFGNKYFKNDSTEIESISFQDNLITTTSSGADLTLSSNGSPLVKIDIEMKNSLKLQTEIKKDRLLSLSFDNNLLTEIQGNEYILGLGYRVKDLQIRSRLGGSRQLIKSDLNMKADFSVRNNKTIVRYLDLENNQVTSGQTILNLKYSADYAFSQNLTGIFYFDYSFSEYAISTAFPQTTIRAGFTMRYNFGN